jgi:chemotaxis protein histidine kinase CheA
MDEKMNGTLRFFIETSAQLLVQMENTLQRIAEGADRAQCVDQVFGAAKAIGNRAAELGAGQLAAFVLAMESTLDRIRRGELEVNDEVVEQLLKACAHIGVLLTQATERDNAEQMNCSRLREFMREIDAMTTLQAWLRKVRYESMRCNRAG